MLANSKHLGGPFVSMTGGPPASLALGRLEWWWKCRLRWAAFRCAAVLSPVLAGP